MLRFRYISLFVFSVFITCCFTQSVLAQGGAGGQLDTTIYKSNIKGPLEFKGRVKELSKQLKGAIITLYESKDGSHDNLTEVYRTVTPGSGLFEFKLEINKFFVLAVEKGGYTTKKVDFDTDVSLAREQHTSVAKFEFEVDMVKDLDGLAFTGAVAHVFYQIKSNDFNYQLDYSKDDLDNAELELREKERQRKEAELAYQKKKALEEAAKLLLDKDNATAQQIIEAAILVGDGDKNKTVKGFLDVFSEVDTLRNRKSLAMYDRLLEERSRIKTDGGKINFQAIFDSAQTIETEVEKESEAQRQKLVSELRSEKEEVARKAKEAMVLEQKAAEAIAKERLAKANAEEEARKSKKKQDKHDEVYYAIFNADGNSETAIQNLIKTYPKGDPYREQKAKAIFAEYENSRLKGTTLSKMDFADLFNAADVAEQKAIQEELAKDRAKGSSALDAFKQKVEEQKKKEQEEIARKIEEGLKDASVDRASQLEVFKNALPKNDSYKDEKAAAMYDEYLQQKKIVAQIEAELKSAPQNPESQKKVFYNALPEGTPDREGTAQRMYDNYTASKQAQGGTGTVSMDFGSLFGAANAAGEAAQLEAKEENAIEKQKAQEALEAQRNEVRQEKAELAEKAKEQVKEVHRQGLAEAKNKKERELASAIEKGEGDRDKTVIAIQKTLIETGDKELDRNKAEAIYDAYLQESSAIKQSGNLGTKVNFAALFNAAEKAELESLERKFEAKQAKQAEELAIYEKKRTETAITTAKTEQIKAEKDVELAAIAYEEVLHKTEVQRQERLAGEKKREEDQAKQLAMEDAKRDMREKERAGIEVAQLEKDRVERLELEQKEAAEIASAEADKKRKEEELAANQEKERLAIASKEREKVEAEQRKLELVAENKRKADALAAQKAADNARLAEEKALADAENKRKADELAAAKAEVEARKAEEKTLADAENKRKADELAAAKAEEEARKAEEKALADAENKRKEEEIAAAKAAEEQRKLEEQQLADIAKKDAEEAEKSRKANYDALVSEGDKAIAKNDFRSGWKNYKDALALYPDDKDASKKFKEANVEVERIEKEQADQLALDTKYTNLMNEAEQELDENNFDAAKIKFSKASELKPKEQEPKQKLRNIDRTLEQIAADKKREQDDERKYILLLQDGNKALAANNLEEAKSLFEQASSLKPDESEPSSKLSEIAAIEEQTVLAAAEDQRRKDEAKKEFDRKAEDARNRKQAEDELLAKEKDARLKALEGINDFKEDQSKTEEELAVARKVKYDEIQKELEGIDLNESERKAAFLSALAKIYPEGLTKETVDGKNFVLLRHVINTNNVVTIYEKKTWDWGGVFYFKDADIAITEAIYELEIGKY